MMNRILPLGFLLALLFAAFAEADTLRVANYNATNLRGSTMGDRTDDFLTVFEGMDPDVALLQEIIDEDAVDNLLSFVFLQLDDDWQAANFSNGPDTDNAFLYRSTKVELISQRQISTSLRDISEYVIRPLSMPETTRVYLYTGHLKASQGGDNEERRRREAQVLRTQLNQHPEGTLFMFTGDFNLYSSSEAAYELMLDSEPDPDGQLFDPIDTPGNWHNSASFADIHTQSPQGDFGGMDDRFDFILVSATFMSETGTRVLPESYTAYGNDGQHFNQGISEGVNHVVSSEIAFSLEEASDHLPVICDFVFETPDAAAGDPVIVSNFTILSCYPNPFNALLSVEISGLSSRGVLTVYDLIGRRVMEETLPSAPATSLSRTYDFTAFGTGVYFVSLRSDRSEIVRRVLYLK